MFHASGKVHKGPEGIGLDSLDGKLRDLHRDVCYVVLYNTWYGGSGGHEVTLSGCRTLNDPPEISLQPVSMWG